MKYISTIIALFLLTNNLFGMESWTLEANSPLQNIPTQIFPETHKAHQSNIFTINLISAKKKTIIKSCSIKTESFPTPFITLNNMFADCSEDNQKVNLLKNFVSKYAFRKLLKENEIAECLKLYANNKTIQQKEIISKLNYLTAAVNDNHLIEIFAASNYLNCIPLVKACVKIIGKKAGTIANPDESINYLNKISCFDLSNAVAKNIINHSVDINSLKIRETKFPIKQIETPKTYVQDISSNGKLIAVFVNDQYRTIHILERESGNIIQTLNFKQTPTAGVFSHDGNYFAIGTVKNGILIYNIESGKCIQTITKDAREIESLVFSKNGTKIAAGFANSGIQAWDIKSKEHTHNFTGCDGNHLIYFSTNGKFAIRTYQPYKQRLHVWNLKRTVKVFARSEILQSFCFSSDNKHIATGNENGDIKIWNYKLESCIKEFPTRWVKGPILSLCYILNDTILIAEQKIRNGSFSIDFWNAEGVCIKKIPISDKICISHDGQHIVTKYNFDTITTIDFDSFNPKFNCLQYLSAPQAVVFKHCVKAMRNNKKITLSEKSMKLYNELPEEIRKHFDKHPTSSWCSLSYKKLPSIFQY